jgi:hypothetical protein
VKVGYRVVSITGSALMTIGFIGLVLLTEASSKVEIFAVCTVVGAGMGMQMLSLLLAVQHGVERSMLGIATSLNQFSRSIGAAVGVAAMGAILTKGLHGVAIPRVVNGTSSTQMLAENPGLKTLFATALHDVFIAGAVVSGAGLVATLFLPAVDFTRGVRGAAGEEMLTAEMANLDRENEPVAIPE